MKMSKKGTNNLSRIKDWFSKKLGTVVAVAPGVLYARKLSSEYLSYYPSEFIATYFPTKSGPGVYSEIGRKAKDFLCDDFTSCRKIILAKNPFYLSLSRPNELMLVDANLKWTFRTMTNDLTICSDASDATVAFTSTVRQVADDLLPGLDFIYMFNSAVPNSQVEVQHLSDYSSFRVGIGGLCQNPTFICSPVLGTKNCCLGLEVLFDINNRNFATINGAFSFTNGEQRTISLALNDRGQHLVASYYQDIDPSTSVGAEFGRMLGDQGNCALTVGVRQRVNPSTTVHARVDSAGTCNVLLQSSIVKLVGELNVTPSQPARFGIGIALNL